MEKFFWPSAHEAGLTPGNELWLHTGIRGILRSSSRVYRPAMESICCSFVQIRDVDVRGIRSSAERGRWKGRLVTPASRSITQTYLMTWLCDAVPLWPSERADKNRKLFSETIENWVWTGDYCCPPSQCIRCATQWNSYSATPPSPQQNK
jgi:hypothetical protein